MMKTKAVKAPPDVPETPVDGASSGLVDELGPVHLEPIVLVVRRQFKESGDLVLDPEEETEEIAVQDFAVDPARVHLRVNHTNNMGNYWSMSVQVGIDIPCYREEFVQAFEFASKAVAERLGLEIEKGRVPAKDARAWGQPVLGDLMAKDQKDRFKELMASDLIKKIQKTHGKNILTPASDFRVKTVPRIPTGIFSLDLALGGGFPAGRANIVWGNKSTGKTVICLRALGNAQKMCANCYSFPNEAGKCTCGKYRQHVCAYLDVEGCVAGDQEILDPWSGFVGSVETFMNPEEERFVASFQDGEVSVEPASVRVDSGVQPVVVVQTRTTSLKCTPNHPILAWRGGAPKYVEAADLSPGESIARPRRTSFEGLPTGVDVEEAELLGLLLGDGSFDEHGSIGFTSKDEDLWVRVSALIERWGVRPHRYDDRHGRLVHEMSTSEHRWGEGNLLRRRLHELGYLGQKTRNKSITGEVLRSSTPVVSALLLGLWMSDGSVNPSRPSVFFTSTSRTLAIQTRWLLARIGVLGRLHTYHDGCSKHAPWYTVTVNGREALHRFRDAVPLYGRKGDLLDAWCCSKGKRVCPCKDDLLPGYINSKHYRSREEWSNDSDVWWDKVLSVSSAGENRCFDVGVSGGHSWTVSDVVVHNSWDHEWAQLHGVDPERVLLSVPEYAEQTLDIAEALLRSTEVDLIVVDSIAFLTPAKEIEESTAKPLQAEQARVLGRGIRKFGSALNYVGNHEGRRPTLIFTNQVRMKVGVLYGCFHEDTPVMFDNGEQLPIREVVEKQLEGPVLSWNGREIISRKIVRWRDNGVLGEDERWLTFRAEGTGGALGFTATPGHVLVDGGGREILAGDVRVGGTLMSYKLPADYRAMASGFSVSRLAQVKRLPVPSRVIGIWESEQKQRSRRKYDLTIEGDSYYLVGGDSRGVVVHNSPEVQPGGNAPGFMATTETKTYGGKYEMDDMTGRPLHVDMDFRVEKNKSAGPKMEGSWRLMLADTEIKKKGEIYEEPSMVDLGVKIGLVEKEGSGNTITCFGEKYRSKSLLVTALVENADLKTKYRTALMSVLTMG